MRSILVRISFSIALLLLELNTHFPLAAQTVPNQDAKKHLQELNKQSDQLNASGKHAEAMQIAKESLRIAESSLSPDDPEVASSLSSLAGLYRKKGEFKTAEPLLQRALRIREKALGPEHRDYASSLNDLGELYDGQANYATAEPLLQRALSIREKVLGPEHPDVANSLNNIAELYRKQANYKSAEPLYLRAVRIQEKALGPDHPDLAETLNNLALLYDAQGKHKAAEPLLQRALRIFEKTQGAESANVAMAMDNLAGVYKDEGNYAEAEPLYLRGLHIREKTLGAENEDVAISLNNLADMYQERGKYAAAEPLYQRSLHIQEKALGPDHPDVATVLGNLALLYKQQGEYAAAEPLYQRALRISEKALGPEHPDVANELNNLAGLYLEEANYGSAEPLLQRSLRIREKAFGPDHPAVANGLNNLAQLYQAQGKEALAEPLLQRALRIQEKAQGPESLAVYGPLNNLGTLYYSEGNYALAEPLFQRALHVEEKALGADHPDLAVELNNLAQVYQKQEKSAAAELLMQRALKIDEKALGPENPHVATMLDNLAAVYDDERKYAASEPLYQRALRIREKALGPQHPSVAGTLNNLGQSYREQGKDAAAEPLLQRALEIDEKALGPDNSTVTTMLGNLGNLYFAQRLPEKAQPYYTRSFDSLFRRFQYYFTYMSEKERLAFFESVADKSPKYFSFVLHFHESEPQLVGKMYDLILWQKGFIANSIASLRRKIEASGDPEALRLLEQLTAKRTQTAMLINSHPADRDLWRKQIEQRESEANELERALVTRSVSFAQQEKLERATWQEVRDALKPGEAAVEFVRFPFYDGRKVTNTSYYVALVVTPSTKTAPAFVMLGDSSKLEAGPITDYSDRISGQTNVPKLGQSTFYEAFWKPLTPELGNARRIYLSPDGVLYQASLGIVMGADNRLLLEDYDLHILSSSKDILAPSSTTKSRDAVLIGDPAFDMTEEQQRAAAKKVSVPLQIAIAQSFPGTGLRSRGAMGTALHPLPATAVEVAAVSGLLQQHKWQVQSYTDTEALEEVVKRIDHPRVLHVATHGFFLSDQRIAHETAALDHPPPGLEDPMLRSGLYFAGANRVLGGQTSSGEFDTGVFTALEATGLNLQGTELVVLSACETGRGHTQNGEGVFGLRRALQVAGAESVLMSMWSVPDEETRELMTIFYQKWLGGEDKHKALREAQLQERDNVIKRYGRDIPYYWGAFVLVGR